MHGYHPLAEDGGLYAASILHRLDPSLFQHDRAFVIAQSRYSLFAPVMAATVRYVHIPLDVLLLLVHLLGIWLLLYAASRIARQCLSSSHAVFTAAALVAAWFTLPVAGTSLLMMDPAVTARTLSTPLALLALAFALGIRPDRPHKKNMILRTILCLLAAVAFHPLMAIYAAGFIVTLFVSQHPSSKVRIAGWLTLAFLACTLAATLQAFTPPDTTAATLAAFSRYYWFLSQWQWFELAGLAGPLLVFALLLHFGGNTLTPAGISLCRAAIALGAIATLIALLFAQQHYATHMVARLQPLRAFLLIYAVMSILLGGAIANLLRVQRFAIFRKAAPAFAYLAVATSMFYSQRLSFPSSQHLEFPGRTPTNPWSQAFLWCRKNTPPTAVFAIDADYITTPGEDAQTFRATAQRNVLPDYSKDGGEAAILPALASDWLAGSTAQQQLSSLGDLQRDARLQPFAPAWVVLHADAATAHPCPYNNGTVKVCSLAP